MDRPAFLREQYYKFCGLSNVVRFGMLPAHCTAFSVALSCLSQWSVTCIESLVALSLIPIRSLPANSGNLSLS